MEQIESVSLDSTVESQDASATEESQEQGNQELQKQEPKQVAQARAEFVEVDGKQYTINEKILNKYYGFDENEKLTDREYKSMAASYKAAIHSTNTNREAKNKEAAFNEFMQKLQNNPIQLMKEIYASNNDALIKLSEEILLEYLENEMLDPKEREYRTLKEENERLKKEREKEELTRKEQKELKIQEEYSRKVESEIIDALEMSDLPKTENTVKRIANYLIMGIDRGLNLTVSQVIPLVQEDIQNELSELIGKSDNEKLLKFLGEDKLKVIRQADLSRLKTFKNTNSNSEQENKTWTKKDKPEKKSSMSPTEFREYTRKIAEDYFTKNKLT